MYRGSQSAQTTDFPSSQPCFHGKGQPANRCLLNEHAIAGEPVARSTGAIMECKPCAQTRPPQGLARLRSCRLSRLRPGDVVQHYGCVVWRECRLRSSPRVRRHCFFFGAFGSGSDADEGGIDGRRGRVGKLERQCVHQGLVGERGQGRGLGLGALKSQRAGVEGWNAMWGKKIFWYGRKEKKALLALFKRQKQVPY